MRLALLSHHRIVPGEGVSEKLLRTARCWRSLGHETDLLELPTGGLVDPAEATSGLAAEPPPRLRAGWIVRHQSWFARAARTLLANRPDAIFVRQGLWCPAFERLVKSIPTFFEINSDPVRELSHRSRLASTYWQATWPRLARHARGFTAVTSELVPQDRVSDSIVIGNSIEVRSDPPRRCPRPERPTIAMPVGSPSPWHGIDHAIEIARRIPEAHFRLIGVPPTAAPPNVEFVPRVSEPELRALLETCHAGLASLAIARAGLREACPLKSRTMLAAGLPIAYGYVDPDLPDDAPFARRVDIDRHGLDAAAEVVRSLLRHALGDSNLGLDAWRFAREHLDLRVKEMRRLEFIESCIRTARTATRS